jgi:hypothetical protein
MTAAPEGGVLANEACTITTRLAVTLAALRTAFSTPSPIDF